MTTRLIRGRFLFVFLVDYQTFKFSFYSFMVEVLADDDDDGFALFVAPPLTVWGDSIKRVDALEDSALSWVLVGVNNAS
jgi:hypothetical protein